ncbi:tRNA epoxyqueuosine(34) reductase QueG [Clostridium sp. Mt-5]|uniref:tRNA epoxyqueuosine(34) reductase QueG n=1 Tax=Clostridium moutaii TaxID=3240932 RepID=A0ABV4BTW0_9CLOT
MDYKEKILDYCHKIGLDTVGFTQCRIYTELKSYLCYRKENLLENEFEESDIKKRINYYEYMDGGKTIISIAFPYLFKKDDGQKNVKFSMYTRGKDYHKVVENYLRRVCGFIESLGGKVRYFVDSNFLPERYIAFQCGIGFIGKNNMLITDKYGSYVFLGEIITDIKMESDIPMESKCGSCRLCEIACPTGALIGHKNSNRCMSYITQKKDIDSKWFTKFQGRLFGCDTCQKACPYNSDVVYSSIEDFKPFDFMENVDLNEIVNIDKKMFIERYGNTSCGWRGKNIIQRNGIINALILGKDVNMKNIRSAYVKNYYDRLLHILKL